MLVMEELLSCTVCCERYAENIRHPVLLPRCGHTFCRPCVGLLSNYGCIVCPTCRTDQRIDMVDKLPTEFALLAITNAQDTYKLETCTKHFAKLSFWCKSCQQSTCGECLFEDHPMESHKVIKSSSYIGEMKQTARGVAMKFMDDVDGREQFYYKTIFENTRQISNAVRNVGVLRRDLQEARDLLKNIKEKEETIASVTSLSETAKFLALKWNIQASNFNNKKEENCNKDDNNKEDEIKNVENEVKESTGEEILAVDKTAPNEQEKHSLKKSKTLPSVNTYPRNKEVNEEKAIYERKSEKDSSSTTTEDDSAKNLENVIKSNVLENEVKINSTLLDLSAYKPRGRLARKALAKKVLSLHSSEVESEKESIIKDSIENAEEKQVNEENGKEKDPKIDEQSVNDRENKENVKENTESNQSDLENENSEGKFMDFLQVPGFMVAFEGRNGQLAGINWDSTGMHVFCFRYQDIPNDILVKSSILSTLIPSKSPDVYLDISAGEKTLGRVYIELWGHLKRSFNFLTLCLGDQGESYLSSLLLDVYSAGAPGERILGGDYENNDGTGGKGVIDDLEWSGDYALPMEEGMITAASSWHPNTSSQFLICTQSDPTKYFCCPFGKVTSGLDVLREAIRRAPAVQICIADCGVLIRPPCL